MSKGNKRNEKEVRKREKRKEKFRFGVCTRQVWTHKSSCVCVGSTTSLALCPDPY